MNAFELTTAVNSIAVAISSGLSDDDLNLLSAILSQISSVLQTIYTQRSIAAGSEDQVSPVIVSSIARSQVASAPLPPDQA